MRKVSDKTLLRMWREVGLERAGHRCEYPGCNETGESCSSHHWFSRNNLAVRYCPDNLLLLCAGHHTGNTISAHRSPFQFKKVIIENCVRSGEWADQVMIKARQVVKDDKYFRETWKFKLLNELKRIAA